MSQTSGIPNPTPQEIEEVNARQKRYEDALKELRSQRDTLIDATDKYVTPDFPMDDEKRKEWYYYRQHLRDLPAMASPDLDEDGNLVVEWPEAPN